jgi:hypothetical protein
MTYYVTMVLEVPDDRVTDEEHAVENRLREAAIDSGWHVVDMTVVTT